MLLKNLIGYRTPNVCSSLPEMSLPYFLIASITRNTSFKFRKKTSLMDEKEGREREEWPNGGIQAS